MQRLIEPDIWDSFCVDFSHEHQGWLVTVGVLSTSLLEADASALEAAHPLSGEIPLHGVELEGTGDQATLVVSAGEPPQHLVHRIDRPERMFMLETGSGQHGGLRIDGADGMSTLLRFRVAVHPEVVDGVMGL